MSETEESAVNKITQKEYADILKEVSPDSPLGPDMLKAFVVGGIICTIGQCFLNFYMKILQERDLASTATSISLIFIAAALTACNVFDRLAKFAGAGTLVPITGFSMPLFRRQWNIKRRDISSASAAKCLSLRGLSLFTERLRPSSPG